MKRIVICVLTSGPILAQVSAIQNPVPGATTSVNTLNPSIQVQGAYAGSVADEKPIPGTLKLSLREAIARGIRTNLSGAQFEAALREARGQAIVSRSALLPNVSGYGREVLTKVNLRAFGVRFPGAPGVVGPFNYLDFRATVSQSLFDYGALTGYKASKENIAASNYRLADAKDIVVFAVSGAYLQTLTAEARIRSARIQVDTAKTLYDQAAQQNKQGILALVDANRIQVQLQTQQQRLITLENDAAKQKLNLARIIGLAPGQEFELVDAMPFQPQTDITQEQALAAAIEKRSDLQALQAVLRAAQLRLGSVRAARLPSLSLNADYGAIGTTPAQIAWTYTVTGNVRIPIWAGGRVSGETEQAAAELEQRRAELADLRGRIDSEIRSTFLDLQTAASQARVAQSNIEVARQSLELTRQRFDAGVADTGELSIAQETLASAEQDVITSQFAHNLAKAALARSMGRTEESILKLLNLP